MRSVQSGPAVGVAAALVLLAVLAGTVGLTAWGWVIGIACAVFVNGALAAGLRRHECTTLGPASGVTLTRATLTVGVAALTAASWSEPIPVAPIVLLSATALILDGVDGQVARRTGTVSVLGARFDMEIDALLILVLSVFVAPSFGWWVLAIGAARYVFVAAGWSLPWLRGPLPPRHWRKVVAATQGIALTVVAAGVLPRGLAVVVLLAALALLAESFGRDAWWLWTHGRGAPSSAIIRGRSRSVASLLVTAAALLLLWLAVLAPNDLAGLTPVAFLRIPVELLLLIGLTLALPPRAGRVFGMVIGVLVGVLTIVKFLDMGFLVAFGRPSNPAIDWTYFGSAVDLLSVSVGRREALLIVVGGVTLAVAVLVAMPFAVLRVTQVGLRHRRGSIRLVGVLGAVWIALAVFGVHLVAGAPAASASEAELAFDHLGQVVDGVRDQQTFAEAAAVDPLRRIPDGQLLTGLRGKDVIVAFVESYGRVAVEGSTFSPGVDAVLDDGTRRLRAAGFASRSAFLTSPTFGGISWLAHSTLQSGLWIDNQQRYDKLLVTARSTLSGTFQRAGWRTVSDVPSNEQDWSAGASFYGYDTIYDARNVGYRGPNFSYASMPDQYVLAAFQRRELADPQHPPVMAEIDLVSSHTPWTPLPRMVDWSAVGDGSVFDPMPGQGPSKDVLWRDADQVRTSYGHSIEYTLSTLVSFVENYGNDNLVLVVLGDHQPATIVSGPGASHDVPITIIARDPEVVGSIAGWGWQDGMRPEPQAPVWRMDAFRDRFLTAFGTPLSPSARTDSTVG